MKGGEIGNWGMGMRGEEGMDWKVDVRRDEVKVENVYVLEERGGWWKESCGVGDWVGVRDDF